jgi:hypothetical protein
MFGTWLHWTMGEREFVTEFKISELPSMANCWNDRTEER